jgi:hypothetical protein
VRRQGIGFYIHQEARQLTAAAPSTASTIPPFTIATEVHIAMRNAATGVRSVLPEALESIRRKLGVPHGVLAQ